MRIRKKLWLFLAACLMMLCLSGCILRTAGEMYSLPKRSAEYRDLQAAIDSVMSGLQFSAPTYGENQQTVQMADLDGDGKDEALVFARGGEENPLKIFIFQKTESAYVCIGQIESVGSSYVQAEYVQMDDAPGMELIVGRMAGEEVPRALSVYTFRNNRPELLLSTNYARFLTTDLDRDERRELFVLSQDTQTGKGVAQLYTYRGADGMERSTEAIMSVPADRIRRIATGDMCKDTPAVFVASVYDENTIITDVYAVLEEGLTNVSLSNESGTSVGTIRNYYVYADDIDGDGRIELPALVPMHSAEGQADGGNQSLIQWYNLDRTGGETVKLTTYHNYSDGWYMVLPEDMAEHISVIPGGDGAGEKTYLFGLWVDEVTMERLFTVYSFTGDDREEKAAAQGLFELGRKAETIYCASMGAGNLPGAFRQEYVAESFHFIQIAWKTGRT